jgi:hypothetical protein
VKIAGCNLEKPTPLEAKYLFLIKNNLVDLKWTNRIDEPTNEKISKKYLKF